MPPVILKVFSSQYANADMAQANASQKEMPRMRHTRGIVEDGLLPVARRRQNGRPRGGPANLDSQESSLSR